MSDVQEVRERLKRVMNGEPINHVYLGEAPYLKPATVHPDAQRMYEDDVVLYLRHDLATQPADDEGIDYKALVEWIDNKLDQCDFERYPGHGLAHCIMGSMNCVVADSQMYRRFVKLQKVVNAQKPLAEHITKIREEMNPLTPEEVERVKELTGDVRDCLDGNLPHDSMTYRGTLLHQLMEVILPMLSKLEQMK